MSFRRVFCIILLFAVAYLTGCHATNRAFRAKNPVLSLAPPPVERPQLPCAKGSVEVQKTKTDGTGIMKKMYQDEVATTDHPCVAFIEFDDMGEPFARDGNGDPKQNGRPQELNAAINLIRDSRQYARGVSDPDPAKNRAPSKLPIVVVFIHGWKHNASEPDLNVQGFEDTIRYLSGQPVSTLRKDRCPTGKAEDQCQYADHPIIGIYIGWRGDLVNKYLPIAQDFSYFNRETAAEHTGSDNLTHALMAISNASGHGADSNQQATNGANSNKPSDPSFLMFIGHSFGGLVLERSVNQALIREFDRTSGMKDFDPLADLIVYVNSAAAATFSKPMVDILAQRRARFGHPEGGGNDALTAADAQPLILSVSTPADAATNVVLPVAQNIGSISKHLTGSFLSEDPMACYDPYRVRAPTLPEIYALTFKQSLFYTHTAPHIEQMHSHEMIELKQKTSTGEVPMSCPDNVPASGPTDGYVRMFRSVPDRCFILVHRPDRCNGTPYWIMRVDKSIIPDHGTIFTGRFINFLTAFLPKPQPSVAPGSSLAPELEIHSKMMMDPNTPEPPTE